MVDEDWGWKYGVIVNDTSNNTCIKKIERPIILSSTSSFTNLASSEYEQTYCVMKGTVNIPPLPFKIFIEMFFSGSVLGATQVVFN